MAQLFAPAARETQGYLFADPDAAPAASPSLADDDAKRRPGETALDFRIRRQYRDVAATAPLFPARCDGERARPRRA